MHKYQPRIHLVRVKAHKHHHHQQQQQQHHSSDAEVQTTQPTASSSAETLSDLEVSSHSVVTFVFAETMFTAVTAYQNQLVNLHNDSFFSIRDLS